VRRSTTAFVVVVLPVPAAPVKQAYCSVVSPSIASSWLSSNGNSPSTQTRKLLVAGESLVLRFDHIDQRHIVNDSISYRVVSDSSADSRCDFRLGLGW
jgi:hypothetical protein